MTLNCPRCPKLCNFPWEMKRHLLIHLKQDKNQFTESKVECTEKECGKTFANQNYLVAHKRIHTDEALVCTVDAMKFLTKQALQRHMIIHSGEQPFQCAVCGNKFAQPSNMRTHVKTVHKYSVGMNRANKCEYCGEAHSSVVSLHHHLLEEHTDRVKDEMRKYFTKLQTKNHKRVMTPNEHNKAVVDAMIEKLNQEKISIPKGLIENTSSYVAPLKHLEPPKEAGEVALKNYKPTKEVGEVVLKHDKLAKEVGEVVLKEEKLTEEASKFVLKHEKPAKDVSKVVPEWEKMYKFHQIEGLVMGLDWDRSPSQGRFYTCEQCGKTFSWRFEILFHGLCHLKDDKGQAMNRTCPECETISKNAVGLKHHLISHTREMPFQCLHCGKHLASQTELKVHIESVHFVTSEQNLVVEAMIEDVQMTWEEVEEKRNEIVLVEGMEKEVELTRKQVLLVEGRGKTFSFTGAWG